MPKCVMLKCKIIHYYQTTLNFRQLREHVLLSISTDFKVQGPALHIKHRWLQILVAHIEILIPYSQDK